MRAIGIVHYVTRSLLAGSFTPEQLIRANHFQPSDPPEPREYTYSKLRFLTALVS
jgi:hypothetical protein